MKEPEVFVLAEEAMKKVVDQIKDDQWGMEMPKEFKLRSAPEKPITLREIINYHAYDDAWVPDMLRGKTMDEIGKEAFKGDLLGSDPKGNFTIYADKAINAARNFTDLDKAIHLSYGDYPAREYFWHITSFRGFRAVELAKVIDRVVQVAEQIPILGTDDLFDERERLPEERGP